MRHLALALSLLMASGCATVQPVQFKSTEGPISAKVEYYISALYLSVKNNGDRPLSLRRSDITLVDSNGQEIKKIEGKTIREKLEEAEKNDIKKNEQEKLMIFLLLFPPSAFFLWPTFLVGAPFGLAAHAYYKTRRDVIENQLDREFKDLRFSKNDEATGFILLGDGFTLGGKLVLRFVDETDGTDFVVSVSLEN